MTRTIPAALQTHLDTQQTTLCYLLKIVPVEGTTFGVTSLDQDVDYDDGDGSLTYSAVKGMNSNAVESSANLQVPNTEAMILVGTNFTKAEIAAGVLDYASFYLYRINWANTANGHFLIASGTTGQVRSNNDLAGIVELRGIPQQLKQSYIDVYSITCRARFASQAGDELFPCLFDDTSLWQNNVVAAVASEADREFTLTTTPSATGPNGALPWDVAIIEFLTGNNAGLTVETEAVDTGTKVVTLRFHAPYAVEVGDTLRARPDCAKRYEDDCVDLFDNGDNFRGEPWIPLTEESPSTTPGANIKGLGAPSSYTP